MKNFILAITLVLCFVFYTNSPVFAQAPEVVPEDPKIQSLRRSIADAVITNQALKEENELLKKELNETSKNDAKGK